MTAPCRRWFRFSLRAMMLLVVVVAVAFLVTNQLSALDPDRYLGSPKSSSCIISAGPTESAAGNSVRNLDLPESVALRRP